MTFGGVVALTGALVGFVISVSEAMREGDSLAAIAVGIPVLALSSVFAVVYGAARIGEHFFGAFGWGLAIGFLLILVGGVIGGLIYGLVTGKEI